MPRIVLASLTATLALSATALRVLRRVEVSGRSMAPTFEPGDRLVLVPVRRARPGDVVGVVDPREPGRLMVKRVTSVTGEGYEVAGDNPDGSTDSRHFGTVPAHHLRGRAVYRYWPDERRGRV